MWRLSVQDSAGTQGAPGRGWGRLRKGQQAKDIFLQEVTKVFQSGVRTHVQGGEIQQGSCRGGTWRGAGFPNLSLPATVLEPAPGQSG